MALYIISSVDVFFSFARCFSYATHLLAHISPLLSEATLLYYMHVSLFVCVLCMFELMYIVQRTVFAVAVDGPPLN